MNKVVLPLHGGEALSLVAKRGFSLNELLDFSSNTFFSVRDLTQTLASKTEVELGHYPDPENFFLSSALAYYESVAFENILATNGSSELIHLIFLALKPKKVLLIGPVFSEYPRACEIFGVDFEVYTPPEEQAFDFLADDLKHIKERSFDLMIFCSPNNPAGATYLTVSELIEQANAKYVLWDASYKDFLYGESSFELYSKIIQDSVLNKKLLCLCSLTKFFACPGIRLGYLIAHSELVGRLRKVQNFWAIGSHAATIGQVLIENVALYRSYLDELKILKKKFHKTLLETEAFDNLLSGPSFITAKLKSRKSFSINTGSYSFFVKEKFLEKGIILRCCDNILGMPPGYLRMQVRDEQSIQRLKQAFLDYLSDIC
ncbi:aminotransferase class I/II-fold pyridoxal phosphate-dependent enzyme [Desulfovibrio litoralis]|uniref:L-threonine O-3-phosphate decarboxylase n=1 Tax=Desulfovibrio litoralis DSM 11393 TaxID=1121455 RepID=A0A1M7TKA5_9BACT|nr:histidinol-phosphate transaminase [Desulfovibrio litoralis]SHN71161.1 L-threonine O-3-phosphate decarboxylase [Desulfovibrio litoralis DSM 11393]